MKSASLIETKNALEDLAGALAGIPEIAIDTESNSFHNYHDRICLIQISIPDKDFIIDPIAVPDLGPLKTIFLAEETQKIFHAAENDILLLKKHHGFEFLNVFDTLLAAQILGHREVGLASLLARLFDIRLDKGEQRSDWSRRPLSADQMLYAVHDTHHLIRLRDTLLEELRNADRLEAAEEEFQRLAEKCPVERRPDASAYLRIKGSKKLAPRGRGVLQALFHWRERTARSLDRPPFRVLSNETLLELSQLTPASWNGAGRIRGVTPRIIGRYGDEILAAIRDGLEKGEVRAPRPAPTERRERDEWTDEMDGRFRRLREWRNQRAESLDVQPFIVAPNRLLVSLARLAPESIEALQDVPGMAAWRVRDYGSEILDLFRNIPG
ncbi:MAG: HRDC domain-containing protein [Deltaproteobacteria bacterium]|nr:HRDC domain-containing protein [Deltaproteobacteria bacterium]